MRIISSAVLGLLLLSAHGMAADRERFAFLDWVAALDASYPVGASAARDLYFCNRDAAREIGEADRTTPAKLVAEHMAKEAAARCAVEIEALARVVSPKQAKAAKAAILRVNAEVAIGARKGPEVIVCSTGSAHPCGTPLR